MRDDLNVVLIFGLVVSICLGHNPACSAVALGLILSCNLFAKLLQDLSEKASVNEKNITKVILDLSKLSEKVAKNDLKSAFGGQK